MLGDTALMLLDKYRGDLRQLRAAAGRDPRRERLLLKECKGIGEVGADIFCREAQITWDELFPFADRRALEAAGSSSMTTPTDWPVEWLARTTPACSPPWSAPGSPKTSMACWRRRAVEI